jgi:hypothetical protein
MAVLSGRSGSAVAVTVGSRPRTDSRGAALSNYHRSSRRGEACVSTRCASIAKALGEYPGCLPDEVTLVGRRPEARGTERLCGSARPGRVRGSSGSLGNPGDFLASERASMKA